MITYLTSSSELLCIGDYNGAVCALGDEWPGVGKIPLKDGHSVEDYASLLTICGVLSSTLGDVLQVKVQESAKDMLSRSARLFGDQTPKGQEARFWWATSCLRCGEYNEAITIADTLLAEDTNIEVVFNATMVRAIGLTRTQRCPEAFAALASIEMLLPMVSPLTQGKFFLNRGATYSQTGEPSTAIKNYSTAADLFESVPSLRWEAAAVNNLSCAYTDLEQYARAHTFAERAVSLFQRLGDKAHEAKSWDTIARIYIKEENYGQAERHARKAVSLLTADNLAARAEALITHGIALSQCGYQQATVQFLEAASLCEHVGSLGQAEQAYSELWRATRHARNMAENIHEAVRPIEKTLIGRVLEKHGGRITKAATELGLYHNALTRKVKQFGLSRAPKRKSPRH